MKHGCLKLTQGLHCSGVQAALAQQISIEQCFPILYPGRATVAFGEALTLNVSRADSSFDTMVVNIKLGSWR